MSDRLVNDLRQCAADSDSRTRSLRGLLVMAQERERTGLTEEEIRKTQVNCCAAIPLHWPAPEDQGRGTAGRDDPEPTEVLPNE